MLDPKPSLEMTCKHPEVILNQLFEQDRDFLMTLVKKRGPEPDRYKESLNENILIGHGFVKPFGVNLFLKVKAA